MASDDVQLFVPSARDDQIFRFFLRTLHLEHRCRLNVTDVAKPQLKMKELELEGLETVCRHLVLLNGSFPPAQLLGNTQEETAQISQWVSMFLDDNGASGDGTLIKLNTHLADRVYVVSKHLTLADLLIFALIHPDAVLFPVAQYGHFSNLLRWHGFIQDTVDTADVMPPVKRKLPVFDFTPPVKTADTKRDKKAEKKEKKALKAAEKEKDAIPSETNDVPDAQKSVTAKKEKKEKKEKEKKEKTCKKEEKKKEKKKAEPRIDMLDMRIGKILSVKPHPDADTLYVEEIDVGEEKPRQVISGLVKFVPMEEMQNRVVVVCCNLKPANMRGIQSCGMVMCASSADHASVEPLVPPADVSIGESIAFEGYEETPLEDIKPKQKILEALFPDLTTDGQGIANYRGTPFRTSKGHVTSRIANGNVR